MMTQTLSELPKKRYITFKLYYTPETPDNYQPVGPFFCLSHMTECLWLRLQPHFFAVDNATAHFTIGTKLAEEQPDTETLGKVDTGHQW